MVEADDNRHLLLMTTTKQVDLQNSFKKPATSFSVN